ncbi:MAG TPA: hypothetical protein VFV49_02530 [Thermoanaerobaculia bacterium]|nr:hypothetical protein [Thermoanaerobaculia bacterium]
MDIPEQLRPSPIEIGRRLHESRTEAGQWVPRLLELSGPDLSRELALHPELQPGLSQLLLEVVDETVERNPIRAHELTSAVIESVVANMPLPLASTAPYLRGQAWTAHAAALRGIGRHLEALEAIATAYDLYQSALASAWHIAAAEVVEAEILYDMGEREEALQMIDRAAVLLNHGDVERFVRVRIREALILLEAGDRTAAAEVWRRTAHLAWERGDFVLMALLESAMAICEFRHGSADEAARLFELAHDVFDGAGLTGEAIRALRGVAEAAVAGGNFHDAISEYYKVRALWLAAGEVGEASQATIEIVELLLIAKRSGEVVGLADGLVRMFADAGRDEEMQAWMFVRESARAGTLTLDSIDRVRRFLSDLPLQPNARF